MALSQNTRQGLMLLVGAFVLSALFFSLLLPGGNARGEINVDKNGIAIEGYDTVAYFTMRRAVKGLPEYRFRWKNAIWQFATPEHRDMFANDPAKFAPQWGGY